MTIPQQMLALAYALRILDEAEQAHAQAWYELKDALDTANQEQKALRRCAAAVNAGNEEARDLIHQHGADYYAARDMYRAALDNFRDCARELATARTEATQARAAVTALAARPLVEDCKPARDITRALRLPAWSANA